MNRKWTPYCFLCCENGRTEKTQIKPASSDQMCVRILFMTRFSPRMCSGTYRRVLCGCNADAILFPVSKPSSEQPSPFFLGFLWSCSSNFRYICVFLQHRQLCFIKRAIFTAVRCSFKANREVPKGFETFAIETQGLHA